MIKQEDLPVLRHLLESLKDPNNKYGITHEKLSDEIKENYPDRNRTSHDISLEFERLCEFFTKHNIANVDKNSFGILLVPNIETKDADIDIIFNELLSEKKRHSKKNKSEDRQHKLTGWKYYTFWPLFAFATFGGGYSTYDIIRNLNTKEPVKQLQNPIKGTELEQVKKHTLPLDQRNQDSSYQTSSDKETLTPV